MNERYTVNTANKINTEEFKKKIFIFMLKYLFSLLLSTVLCAVLFQF